MEVGNLGNVNSVGKCAWERKIPFGLGYRVYLEKLATRL